MAGEGRLPAHATLALGRLDLASLKHGLQRLREGFPLSNRLIREMHAVLLSKGRGSERSPGEFRRSQNRIGGTRPGNARFVPPPPQAVEDCTAALERFLHDEQLPYPSLVKAALAHVQFETIHPFLDGNGRIGRLLIAFILHHEGFLQQPLLYLSLYFKQHRSEYYRLLDLVRAEGDWEAWLDFFLEGAVHTAQNAVETAQRPILTLNQVCLGTVLTFFSAAKGMDALARLGIAREITGGKRNRIFAYDRYLAMMNEGTELL